MGYQILSPFFAEDREVWPAKPIVYTPVKYSYPQASLLLENVSSNHGVEPTEVLALKTMTIINTAFPLVSFGFK